MFDLDGTLVDSADDLSAAVNAALGRHGLPPLPTATIVGFIGHGGGVLIERSVSAADPDGPQTLVTEVYESFKTHYRAHCLDRTRCYPGVEAALRALRGRGTRLAVLTNKPRGFSEDILRGLGVRGLFASVIGGDDLSTRKPDPEGLLQLVSEAGCARDEVVLVGDSSVDVATAANAGIACWAVTWGFSGEAELRRSGATRLVADPAEMA